MSVFGIDFGTESSVVAIARRGGVDVCINEVSNRQTKALVSFGSKERYIGESGANQINRNPENTIGCVKRLLGLDWDSPLVQAEAKHAHFRIEKDAKGKVVLPVKYGDANETFTPVQIAAMLLSNLADIAAKENGNIKIKDCVIAVPSYWTENQRRALLDASEIVGLNVLRLINETSSAALQYGIPKANDFSETEPTRILFYDLGYSSLNVALGEYTKGKVNIRAVSSDPFTGGREFDRVLFDHFAKRFQEKYKCDVRTNAKATLRLMLACEKCKKVLSANAEAPINVESLLNDRDLSDKITRDEFAQLSSVLYDRMLSPVHKVLQETGLTPADIKACELMGGASRMPVVISQLSGLFGKEPSRTLNQEECIARGAAFMAAMLSPAFKVREFLLEDITPYPVAVSWGETGPNGTRISAMEIDNENGTKTTQLDMFSRFESIPKTKIASFKASGPITVEAMYTNPAVLPQGTPTTLGLYHIKGITNPNSSIKIKLRMNPSGVFGLESAQLFEEYTEMVEETVETPAPAADAAAAAPAADGAAAPAPATIKEKVMVPKTKVRKTDLPFTVTSTSISPEELNTYMEREGVMANQDKLVRLTADAKNAVESYVYDMRERSSADLNDYFDDASRAAFQTLCNETEDWLYGDGSDTDRNTYVQKLAALEAYGKPALTRLDEATRRPEAIRNLKLAIQEFLSQAQGSDAKYEHIEADEKAKVVAEAQNVGHWLDQIESKISGMASKSSNPPVLVAEIAAKEAALRKFVAPIMNKPKPKPAPAPAPDAAGANAGANAGGDAGAQAPPAGGDDKAKKEMDLD